MSESKSFEDSDFVVSFFGECAESRVVRTWDRVLAYIDYAMGAHNDGWTCRGADCELHDNDEWRHLDHSDCGDTRHHFHMSEFGYCVGLAITRITEPIQFEVDAVEELKQMGF